MKQSLDRIVDVIELLSEHLEGMSVTDIALSLGMPASGAHRIVALLMSRGLVDQDPATRAYRLTLKFASIGLRILSGASFHMVVQPLLDRYADMTGELVRLAAVVDDGRLAWIANAQGCRSQLRVDPMAGHHAVPHVTAAGKAWLSALDDAQITSAMARERYAGSSTARGPRALRNTPALRRDLEECRERGYAVTMDEIELGLTAVAAPVVTMNARERRVVASISVAGPTVRIPEARIAELGKLMRAASQELGEVWELLGNQPGSTQNLAGAAAA